MGNHHRCNNRRRGNSHALSRKGWNGRPSLVFSLGRSLLSPTTSLDIQWASGSYRGLATSSDGLSDLCSPYHHGAGRPRGSRSRTGRNRTRTGPAVTLCHTSKNRFSRRGNPSSRRRYHIPDIGRRRYSARATRSRPTTGSGCHFRPLFLLFATSFSLPYRIDSGTSRSHSNSLTQSRSTPKTRWVPLSRQ